MNKLNQAGKEIRKDIINSIGINEFSKIANDKKSLSFINAFCQMIADGYEAN